MSILSLVLAEYGSTWSMSTSPSDPIVELWIQAIQGMQDFMSLGRVIERGCKIDQFWSDKLVEVRTVSQNFVTFATLCHIAWPCSILQQHSMLRHH